MASFRFFTKTSLVLVVLFLVVLFVLNFVSKSDRISPQVAKVVREGDLIPLKKFQSLDGTSLVLSKKVTLIHFWATWCGPCAEELPSFQSLLSNTSSQIQVFAISQDDSENEVRAFMKSMHGLSTQNNFWIVPDFQHNIGNQFKILALPETYIVDHQGVILRKVVGALDWSSVEVNQYFQDLLAK